MTQENNETSIYLYHSNQFVDLLNPKVEDIDIRDIARGLAFECRYNGQIKRFYSVASHSILACRFAPKELKLEALLHDAEEAYIKDLTRGLKLSLNQRCYDDNLTSCYKKIALNLKNRIADRFKLSRLNMDWKVIKDIDNRLLITEAQELCNRVSDWNLDFIPYNSVRLPEWSFGETIEKFLTLYERYKRI